MQDKFDINDPKNVGANSREQVAARLNEEQLKENENLQFAQFSQLGLNKPIKRKSYLSRIIVSLTFVLLFFAVLAFGSYYLLLGKTLDSTAINQNALASVQNIIGTDYTIKASQTQLKLKSLTSLALTSLNVTISKTANSSQNNSAFKIGKIEFELEPLSVFDDVPKIKNIIMDGAVFEASDFSSVFFKPKLDVSAAQNGIRGKLVNIAIAANKIEDYLLAGAFNKLVIKNASIKGADLGRLSPGDIEISNFKMSGTIDGGFNILANLNVEKSEIKFSSNWQTFANGRRVLKFDSTPIKASNWLKSPQTDINIPFGIGSDAQFSISAKIPYKNRADPLQPIIKLSSQNSSLRVGAKRNTQIHSINLNMRLLPLSNQIQVERSNINGLDTNLQFVGSIMPVSKEQGYSGPLNFDIVAEKFTSKAASSKVKTIPVSALLLGQWEWASKHVKFDSIQILAEKKQITGNADITFGGRSPAINGAFETDEFSMDAIRQLWPFFMASTARDWIGTHFEGGYLKNAKMKLAIPNDRIFKLENFIPFEKNELNFTSQYSGLSSKTFGNLPPIFDVSGNVNISGSELIVNVHSAKAHSPAKNVVDVELGSVNFNNFSQKNPLLDIEMHLAGKLSTVIAVADASPLKVAQRVLVNPADLSGDALVDVVTQFRLFPNNKVGALNWNALVTLENASSDKLVFGRELKKADILLEVTPNKIVGKGKARIDGSYSNISFVEPLGNEGKVKREFALSAFFTQKQLKARGLDLAPIINGPLGLNVSTVKNNNKNNVQIYTVDLTKADISLPWIGWGKGAGISAKATFEYTLKNGETTLSNLKFKGEGIDAQGNIKFNKSGIVSLDFKDVTLVGSENFDVNIKKSKGRYIVNVNGDSFDGRSVINKVLHENGLETDVNGNPGNDITLNATFQKVIGFSGKYISNAKIFYETIGGKISDLNVVGSLNDESISTVIAKRINDITNFEIKSQNAGDAFSMVDLYSKMVGGTLSSTLKRVGSGPFVGSVTLRKFTIVGEKKLRAFSNAPASNKKYQTVSGHLKKINVKSVKFRSLTAKIEKGLKYLNVSNGIIRSNEIGFTFEGAAFDATDQMNIRGTFMPAIALSRLVGLIPIVGKIFSNGKDSALLGITYRLRGPIKQPKLEVNPISLVTPGIFNKLFEFKE